LAVLALTPLALHEVVAGMPAAAQSWLQTRSALRRVADLLSAPDRSETGLRTVLENPGRSVLRIHDLTAGWPGEDPVITGLGFEARPGERIGVVGPSGCGKSTLASVIMGFLPPSGGTLEVPARIGYLAQDAHSFDTTVAENVRIGARQASDDQVRAALTAVGLDFDLDRMVGEFDQAVSGGEARRLALARLVVSRLVEGDHDLLIFDEPTEHLDRDNAEQVIELIMDLDPGAALLVITHDPAVMARCDRIIRLQPVDSRDHAESGSTA